MGKIKLILVSNQIILRESLANFLNDLPDFQVMGDTSCHKEALDLASSIKPDLFVADIELPETAVQEIVGYLTTSLPSVNLLFLGSLSAKSRLIELIPVKAKGYLTTDLSSEIFVSLLKDAAEGRPAISPSILAEVLLKLGGMLTKTNSVYNRPELTCREREVLHHLVSGATNREIARSLVISECTVKNHIHNMLDKLKIQNRTKLISYALTNGLVAGF